LSTFDLDTVTSPLLTVDSKSGVSALNLEFNENSGNNQKNMVEDTLDEEEQTNKGEVTVSKSKVDNCTTQNDNVMFPEV
jgi:hypothetical protein